MVKDALGVGKSTIVNWFSPINLTSPEREIDFEYQHLPNDLTLLTQEKYSDYMHKQLLKICHYLQKVRHIEILQMQAEFLRDENNNVWLSYIKDVHYRKV